MRWVAWRMNNRGGDFTALHATRDGIHTLCKRHIDYYRERGVEDFHDKYPRCKACLRKVNDGKE